MCYNIVSVLRFVFLATGQWDHSSLTRDRTHTLCVGRWSLNHWTAREVPDSVKFRFIFLLGGQRTLLNAKCLAAVSTQDMLLWASSPSPIFWNDFLGTQIRASLVAQWYKPACQWRMQLTTSSILNLCEVFLLLLWLLHPFYPFLCLSFKGCCSSCFIVYSLFPRPSFPKELYLFPAERNTSLSRTPMFLNPTQTSFWVPSIQALTWHFHLVDQNHTELRPPCAVFPSPSLSCTPRLLPEIQEPPSTFPSSSNPSW